MLFCLQIKVARIVTVCQCRAVLRQICNRILIYDGLILTVISCLLGLVLRHIERKCKAVARNIRGLRFYIAAAELYAFEVCSGAVKGKSAAHGVFDLVFVCGVSCGIRYLSLDRKRNLLDRT